MTNHGKVDQKKLWDCLKKNDASLLQKNSPEELVKSLLALPIAYTFSAAESFPSLGGDSVQALRFVTYIEEKYGREIPQLMDLVLHKPVRKVLEYLNELLVQKTKELDPENNDVIGVPSRANFIFNNEYARENFSNIGKDNQKNSVGENICPELVCDLDSGDLEKVMNNSPVFPEKNCNSALKNLKRTFREESLESKASAEGVNCDKTVSEYAKHLPCDECKKLRNNVCFSIQRGNRYALTNLNCSHFKTSSTTDSRFTRSKIRGSGAENASKKFCGDTEYLGRIVEHSVAIEGENDCEEENDQNAQDEQQGHISHRILNTSSEEDWSSGLHGAKALEDDVDECCVDVTQKWCYGTGKCVDASPLVVVDVFGHGHVYIGSHSHRFCALSLDTGQRLWEVMLGDRIESSACLSACGKYIIVGCYDYNVYILDRSNGSVYWTFRAGAEVKSSPVVDHETGLVYFGSHDQCVYALDIETQRCLWKKDLGRGSIFASVCLDKKSGKLFVGSLGGRIMALDPDTGDLLWSYNTKKPIFSNPCATPDGVITGCVDGCLYYINLSGNLIWKYETGGPVFSSPCLAISAITASNQMIICGSHDSCVYCLNQSGQCKWKFMADSPVFATPFTFCFTPKDTLTANSKGTDKIIDYVKVSKTCANPEKGNAKSSISHGSSSQFPGLMCETISEQDSFGTKICENPEKGNAKSSISYESSSQFPGLMCETISEQDSFGTKDSPSKQTPTRNLLSYYRRGECCEKCLAFACIFSTKGTMYILDAMSGEMMYQIRLPGEVFSSPVCVDDKIVVGCRDDYVYTFQIQ